MVQYRASRGRRTLRRRGRGVVLDVNHRNTAEVLEFAKQMVADD
ncbi:hypothetical protein [Curtobacterium sp. Csp2]|nr:hypothetical protein [Curtobacterium sp. Csp2]